MEWREWRARDRHRVVAALFMVLGWPVSTRAVVEPATFTINPYLTPPSFACGALADLEAGDCASVISDPVEGDAFIWVVLSAADGLGELFAPFGAASLGFGIQHDVAIESWTSCSGQDDTTSDWPASGSATTTVWPDFCHASEGMNAALGYFHVKAGAAGTLTLTTDRRTGDIRLTDCDGLLHGACADAGGSVDLGGPVVPVCEDDLPKPGPIDGFEASSGSCQLQLTWKHDGSDLARFDVRRDGQPVASLSPAARSFVDHGLPDSAAVFTYEVFAVSGCGGRTRSGEMEGSVLNAVTPTHPTASRDLCERVRITWVDENDNETQFSILRQDIVIATVPANVTQYEDLSPILSNNVPYAVRAEGPCGVSASSSTVFGFARTAPDAPEILEATSGHCGFVQLTWRPQSSNHDRFVILRDGESIAEVDRALTTFRDSTATPDVPQSYAVRAVNGCGERTSAAEEGVLGSAPPPPPSGCAATDNVCHAVAVSWVAAARPDVDGFEIFRDDVSIATADAAARTYSDEGAVEGQTHVYHVESLSVCGNSSPSPSDNGMRVPDAPLPIAVDLVSPDAGEPCATSPVTFVWRCDSAAVMYRLEVRDACDGDVVTVESTTDTTLAVSLDTGSYAWRVQAENACAESGEWSACRDVVSPPAVLEEPSFSFQRVEEPLWHFEWDLVTGAHRYRLSIADECYLHDDNTVSFHVTGTDTTVDVGRTGDFNAWMSAVGCTVSDSMLCQSSKVSAVLLEHFTAEPSPAGVRLSWRTTRETNTLGFNLYRTGEGDLRAPVNDALVRGGRGAYAFEDVAAHSRGEYAYVLAEVEVDGRETDIAEAAVTVGAVIGHAALDVRPNPFNPRVIVTVDLPLSSHAVLDVLDASGRRVARLAAGALPRGRTEISWDGTDEAGRPLASGVYFVRLDAGAARELERVTLLR